MIPAARARIGLGAIKHNYALLKNRHGGGPCMPVIKANAYGHGLLHVAAALNEADCVGVARLNEARSLRAAGIDKNIAVLGGVASPDDVHSAIDLRVQLCVHSIEHIEWLEQAGPGSIDVWLKVNTGMNRLGIAPTDSLQAIDRLGSAAAVDELRLMTHLADADNRDSQTTQQQLESFRHVAEQFSGDLSIANSAGILGWPDIRDTFGDRSDGQLWSRPGISLYGVSPFPDDIGADHDLRPAMQLESHLMATRAVNKGAVVGYGGSWIAKRDTVIGMIAAGYGDGYDRHIDSGAPVLVNGRRVAVAGRVAMDITAVDLGPGAEDRIGDDVVLWGNDLPVETIARRAETIPLTLVTGVSERVERVYED